MSNNLNKSNEVLTAEQLKPKLENPWEIPGSFNSQEEIRFTLDLPRVEADFFRSIRPTRGTVPTLANTLLEKLKQQLIQHGITQFTQQPEFCEFIKHCRIVDGRIGQPTTAGSSTPGTLPEASPSNDNGGKARTPSKDKKRKG